MAFHVSGTVAPTGVTAPIPVTTTDTEFSDTENHFPRDEQDVSHRLRPPGAGRTVPYRDSERACNRTAPRIGMDSFAYNGPDRRGIFHARYSR